MFLKRDAGGAGTRPVRWPTFAIGAVVAFGAASGDASAHLADGPPVAIGWTPVSAEPWVFASLALSALLYAIGVRRLWMRAGVGRGVRRLQAASFAAGWGVLVLALVSPIDALGTRLFCAHMVQHELLMIVAAPLLVVGRPLSAWAWALSRRGRRAAGDFFHHPAWRVPWLALTGPIAAWSLHGLALWLWHVPALFEAALASTGAHALQHSAFLFSALLFWWSVLGRPHREDQGGAAMLSLFTTMLHTGALGALLTLATSAWYGASYAHTTAAFGLDVLEDQQLGGLIMWIPASLVYLVAGLVQARRWLTDDRPAQGRSRRTFVPRRST